MADLQSVLSDPNFQALPLPEKNKVLLRIDDNFRNLAPRERMKALSVIQYHKPLPEIPKPMNLQEGIKQAAYGAALPLAGLGQAVLDIPETAGSVAKAFLAPPETPEETAVSSIPGAVAASRLVVGPMQAEAEKARASTGAARVAHAVASGIPVIGPMSAQVGESIQKQEDVPFTLGRALGWVEVPEAGGKIVGKLVKPREPLPPPEVVNEVMGRVVKDQFERADKALHAEVSKHADHVAKVVDDPARNPAGAIDPKPILGKLQDLWNQYIHTYDPATGATPPAVFKGVMDEALTSPTGRWTFEQTKQIRTAVNDMVGKTKDARIRAIGKQLSDTMRSDMRESAKKAGVEKDFDAYNRLHQQQRRIKDAVGNAIAKAKSGEQVMKALHGRIGYAEVTLPSLKPYGLESDAMLDAAKLAGRKKLNSTMWRGWMVRHASAELLSMLAGAPYMAGYFAGGIGGEMMANRLSAAGKEMLAGPHYGRGMQLVQESLPTGPSELSEPAPIPPAPPPAPKAAPKDLPPLPKMGEEVAVHTPETLPEPVQSPPSKYRTVMENLEQLRMLNAAIRKLSATSKKGLNEAEIEWIGQQTGIDMTQPGAIGKARKALIEKRKQLRSVAE